MRTRLITIGTKLLHAIARRGMAGRRRERGEQVQRLLIVKPCCLGDVLLSTPLVAALRNMYPEAELTYAVGPWSRPMVASSKHIDRVITLPEHWTLGSFLGVARDLSRQRFDAVFVPHRSPNPGLLALLAGIPMRVGLDSRGRGFAYTHPVPVPPGVIHEADLYLLLAEAVGAARPARRLWFFPTARDRALAEEILSSIAGSGPLVVIHAGGGNNPGMGLARKRWLPDRWAQVADILHKRHGARILLVGSAAEREVVLAVQADMEMPATSLAHDWRWGVLAAVIEAADLFLGHDTGMSLLANAVGTRHVVVFGPSDPQIYGPYGPQGCHIWRPTPESPCFYDGAAPLECPCAGACMRNVTVSDVIDAVESALRGRQSEHEVERRGVSRETLADRA